MFQAIASREYKTLRVLGERFYHEHADFASCLLCLEHVFSTPFNLQNASTSDVAVILQSFLVYIRTLYLVLGHPDPCRDRSLPKLFGFQQSSPDMFLVYDGTRLMEEVLRQRVLISKENDGVSVRGPDLRNIIQSWIRRHILLRGTNENVSCRNSPAYSPCAAYVMLGECGRLGGDCYNAHLQSGDLIMEGLSLRVRIILQQILVYQAVGALQGNIDQLKQQRYETSNLLNTSLWLMLCCRYWLTVLHNTLFPAAYKLGSVSALNWSGIPEAGKAIPVVREWLKDQFFTLKPWTSGVPFLTTMTEMLRLAFILDRDAAGEYLRRAECCVPPKAGPFEWLSRKDGKDQPRYVVHDLLDFFRGPSAFRITLGVFFIK